MPTTITRVTPAIKNAIDNSVRLIDVNGSPFHIGTFERAMFDAGFDL